ncbi:hypothetical protein PTE30175_02460 [Pandoraea terrae]|uniref:Uncharacterized protein n=1 Tax=Pandoraea terrae TaxID=1537710 RepID=A0A5E4VD90_9BURK|nr:hypothetical protein PTE30175_02460 [Pandoraea terrae]
MKITKVEIFDCEVNRKDPSMAKFNPVMVRVPMKASAASVRLGLRTVPARKPPWEFCVISRRSSSAAIP